MDTLKLKDYEILLSKLNDKQFKYLYNIMHLIKIGQIPFYHFLCGKSGAGKSLLMHAIYNTIVKYFHKKV
jgi:DNA replication protein DnaC